MFHFPSPYIPQDVVAFVLKYKGKKNVIVGHSLGTILAMNVALRLDDIDGLILVGASSDFHVPMLALLPPPFILEIFRPLAKPAFNRKAFHPETAPELVESEGRVSSTNPMYVMRDLLLRLVWRCPEGLGGKKLKTLFISGIADGLTPVDKAEELRCEIGGRLIVIDKAAHIVMLERPKEVNTAIDEFLADCEL